MKLTEQETQRYARQIRLRELGESGQILLKNAKVLIVGLGGLGSPASLYLATAGVGRLGLIDFDIVDVSNLQRQILYSNQSLGLSKVKVASEKLRDLNENISLDIYDEKLSIRNARSIFSKYDIILDGSDNFATRYLTTDCAFFSKKTVVSASVLGFEGQLSVFDSQDGPCYRCLYPEAPPAGLVPSCAEAGVLGAMVGIMGSMQAMETLKVILGLPDTLKGHLLTCDSLGVFYNKLRITKNKYCPLCGVSPSILELREENFVCALDNEIKEISPQDLQGRLKNGRFSVLDVREASEFSEGKLNFDYHIPIDRLESEYSKISQETPLLIYCRSGARSMRACQFLKSKGYDVFNLKGGIVEWVKWSGEKAD